MVLKMTFDRAGRDVERQRRRGVEIVTRTLVAHPWPTVTGSPIRQVGLRIIVAGDPYRSAAGLPLIALRPSPAAGFSRTGNSIGAPLLFAGIGIVGRHEAADSQLTAPCSYHDLAARDQRSQRDVVAGLVVRYRGRPDFLASPRVQCHQDGFVGGMYHF